MCQDIIYAQEGGLLVLVETVLVVEYGYIDDSIGQIQPSSATNYRPIDMFNLTAVPQPGINNALNATVYAAAVLGGGSTINGMMLDRVRSLHSQHANLTALARHQGAPNDYDNWAALSNPGWGWSDLLPYFKKVPLQGQSMDFH